MRGFTVLCWLLHIVDFCVSRRRIFVVHAATLGHERSFITSGRFIEQTKIVRKFIEHGKGGLFKVSEI